MSLSADEEPALQAPGSDGSDSHVEAPNLQKERRKYSKKKMLRKKLIESKSTCKIRRLCGGADNPPAEPAKEDTGEEEMAGDEAILSAGSSKSFVKKEREPLKTTGDPRVDEMLECALTNLEEAGKALLSLGDNLEHELKVEDDEESVTEPRVETLSSKPGSAQAHAITHHHHHNHRGGGGGGGPSFGRRNRKHDRT